jgi:hypothetical protein
MAEVSHGAHCGRPHCKARAACLPVLSHYRPVAKNGRQYRHGLTFAKQAAAPATCSATLVEAEAGRSLASFPSLQVTRRNTGGSAKSPGRAAEVTKDWASRTAQMAQFCARPTRSPR